MVQAADLQFTGARRGQRPSRQRRGGATLPVEAATLPSSRSRA